VHTQTHTALKLTIGGRTFECQIINAVFKRPGTGAGTTVYTACPDGVVKEPGEPVDGSLTGEAFVDTTDEGLWWALDEAYAAQTTVQYSVTFFPDSAAEGVTFTGDAKVTAPPELGFAGRTTIARHPVDLALLTAVKTRPTVVAAPVKGAAAPGDVFPAEPTVTASDAANAAKLAGLGFVAAPAAAWTTGQKITIGTFDFHRTGTAWAEGAA
jgi:hypothetical protein